MIEALLTRVKKVESEKDKVKSGKSPKRRDLKSRDRCFEGRKESRSKKWDAWKE
jgi:hypothetical protein